MEELIARLLQPQVLVILGIFVVPIVGWVIVSIFQSRAQSRIKEAEVNLKREMIAQGRSVEEIERILKTKA